MHWDGTIDVSVFSNWNARLQPEPESVCRYSPTRIGFPFALTNWVSTFRRSTSWSGQTSFLLTSWLLLACKLHKILPYKKHIRVHWICNWLALGIGLDAKTSLPSYQAAKVPGHISLWGAAGKCNKAFSPRKKKVWQYIYGFIKRTIYQWLRKCNELRWRRGERWTICVGITYK